ncbi:hypothetical protein PIB30_008437 [Stylosanthes scabra]|uniref:RING-type domain-containing protein n=1 Tax=Stylosanthes scabra TaxID=79078 RepID=A0ABU6W8F2_9FABA|nr:hypothetical protein [Stylosanthes scabra]
MPITKIIIRKTTSLTLAHDMGGTLSLKPIFNITFPFVLVTVTTTFTLIDPFIVANADIYDSRETPPTFPTDNNIISARNSNDPNRKSEPFKPSTIIVVSIFAALFFFTFILLLYIKHCIRVNHENQSHQEGEPLHRNNSGIDPFVVEKLPMFRFGSLRGQKEGLDCAVCLNRFEITDVLRLLPKCNHAFHMDCVDKWLDEHSTCPLCRNRVDPKDILTREQLLVQEVKEGERDNEANPIEDIERGTFRRVSGRHSSVLGEREGGLLEIITHNNSNEKKNKKRRSSSSRRSFGGFVRPRKDKTFIARQEEHHRLEHRIIIDSPMAFSVMPNGEGESSSQPHHSWNNEVSPSNLLYLTSEMIISDGASSTRGQRRPTHSRIVINGNENNKNEHIIIGREQRKRT